MWEYVWNHLEIIFEIDLKSGLINLGIVLDFGNRVEISLKSLIFTAVGNLFGIILK